MLVEPLAIAGPKWDYEPQDYRAAADHLRACGVHVPEGTVTDDTIAALVQAASGRTVSPSVAVLLLAFHIVQEQLRRLRAENNWLAHVNPNGALLAAEVERLHAENEAMREVLGTARHGDVLTRKELVGELNRLRAEVAALKSGAYNKSLKSMKVPYSCNHQFTGSNLSSESRCGKCGASFILITSGEEEP